MRVMGIVALGAAVVLTGCVASRQEVAAKLGDQYLGQNVDALVIKFGPPSNAKIPQKFSYRAELFLLKDEAHSRDLGLRLLIG
jgi:hypothetical protein